MAMLPSTKNIASRCQKQLPLPPHPRAQTSHPKLSSLLLSSKNKNHYLHVEKHENPLTGARSHHTGKQRYKNQERTKAAAATGKVVIQQSPAIRR